MKKLLIFTVVTCGIAASSYAAPCGQFAPPPPGTGPVGISPNIGAPGSNGFSCSIGGLTFDNFVVIGAAGTPPFEVDLVGASVIGNTVYLTFNPNLGNPTVNEDIFFYFRVTGGVNQIDLSGVSPSSQGASQPSIGEIACPAAIPMPGQPGANTCAPGTQLAALTVFAGGAAQTSPVFPLTSPLYIFKDIQTPAGTVMSSFTESFVTNVPEPMSFAFLGAGLLALGILRRRL